MNGYCIVLCFSYWNRSLKKNGWAWAVSFIPYWFRAWTKRWQIIVLSTCVQYSILWLLEAFEIHNFTFYDISWNPVISLEYTLEDFVIFIYIYTFRMDIATPIFQGKFFLFVERKGKKIIVPTGATKYFMNH